MAFDITQKLLHNVLGNKPFKDQISFFINGLQMLVKDRKHLTHRVRQHTGLADSAPPCQRR